MNKLLLLIVAIMLVGCSNPHQVLEVDSVYSDIEIRCINVKGCYNYAIDTGSALEWQNLAVFNTKIDRSKDSNLVVLYASHYGVNINYEIKHWVKYPYNDSIYTILGPWAIKYHK